MQKTATNSESKARLSSKVEDALRARLKSGEYALGTRLPSEAQLCEEFSVSRTVVREAIASLRVEGKLRSRQGAGVFVSEPEQSSFLSFQNLDVEKVSTVIEMLELRLAIEVEAAALAAMRHSPAQIEKIIEASNVVERTLTAGEASAEQDFALHMAIAEASNNSRFVEILRAIGTFAIPRRALINERSGGMDKSYSELIITEHQAIVAAICDRDPNSARAATRTHLEGSQRRYRRLIRSDV